MHVYFAIFAQYFVSFLFALVIYGGLLAARCLALAQRQGTMLGWVEVGATDVGKSQTVDMKLATKRGLLCC